jgi:hypothetical protein
MPTSSFKELKRRVCGGEYAVDSGELADDILSKFALIRRVRRSVISEEEAAAAEAEARRGAKARGRRREPAGLGPHRPSRERLS